MHLWLASYPRSGNTLLRTLLSHAFGIETWSLYDDRNDIGASRSMAEAVGHRPHGVTPAAFRARLRSSDEFRAVKTHELPEDDAPAIYVVRDGRSSVVSYAHYMRDIARRPVALEEVVLGAVWPGSWSSHVEAWALSARPRTLVVRYEALAAMDPETLGAIGAHVGRAPRTDIDIDFAAMHALHPAFFRRGSDAANIAELDAHCPAFYAALHGTTARSIGYADGLAVPDHANLAAEWRRFRAPDAEAR